MVLTSFSRFLPLAPRPLPGSVRCAHRSSLVSPHPSPVAAVAATPGLASRPSFPASRSRSRGGRAGEAAWVSLFLPSQSLVSPGRYTVLQSGVLCAAPTGLPPPLLPAARRPAVPPSCSAVGSCLLLVPSYLRAWQSCPEQAPFLLPPPPPAASSGWPPVSSNYWRFQQERPLPALPPLPAQPGKDRVNQRLCQPVPRSHLALNNIVGTFEKEEL